MKVSYSYMILLIPIPTSLHTSSCEHTYNVRPPTPGGSEITFPPISPQEHRKWHFLPKFETESVRKHPFCVEDMYLH